MVKPIRYSDCEAETEASGTRGGRGWGSLRLRPQPPHPGSGQGGALRPGPCAGVALSLVETNVHVERPVTSALGGRLVWGRLVRGRAPGQRRGLRRPPHPPKAISSRLNCGSSFRFEDKMKTQFSPHETARARPRLRGGPRALGPRAPPAPARAALLTAGASAGVRPDRRGVQPLRCGRAACSHGRDEHANTACG